MVIIKNSDSICHHHHCQWWWWAEYQWSGRFGRTVAGLVFSGVWFPFAGPGDSDWLGDNYLVELLVSVASNSEAGPRIRSAGRRGGPAGTAANHHGGGLKCHRPACDQLAWLHDLNAANHHGRGLKCHRAACDQIARLYDLNATRTVTGRAALSRSWVARS